MDRRKFVGASMLTAASLAAPDALAGENQSNKKEFYEWREYEIKWGGSGQAILHTFFEKTLIPALNKYGVKNVGVFREIGKTEPPKIYLLIPYPSFAEYLSIWEKIKKDPAFIEGSQEYDKVPAAKPLFNRVRTSMMIAFDGMPQMKIPSGERIFELRLYEGYSEDAVRRKLKMFNVEEFDIFYRVKLNPVFFGETIAGNNLPSLLYMIWFRNMEERDANWKAFSDDPTWKKVLADPQYANTVSNIIRVFLEPLAYSQV